MAVKKKVRLSRTGMYFLGGLFALLLIIFVPIVLTEMEKNEIASYGYSPKAVETIRKEGLKDYIKMHKDSPTLDAVF